VLEVSDTGMGMSETDQSEVFTKFFRTSSVRQAAIPGLGLSIPRRGEKGGRPETASLSQMPA